MKNKMLSMDEAIERAEKYERNPFNKIEDFLRVLKVKLLRVREAWNLDNFFGVYCDDYDSKFAPETGNWLELKCGSKECKYCSKRPKKHSLNCLCFKEHYWKNIDAFSGFFIDELKNDKKYSKEELREELKKQFEEGMKDDA